MYFSVLYSNDYSTVRSKFISLTDVKYCNFLITTPFVCVCVCVCVCVFFFFYKILVYMSNYMFIQRVMSSICYAGNKYIVKLKG